MVDLTKISISKMSLSDLEEIKDTIQEDFDDFWNYQIIKEEIANTNSSYLVLRYNNEIVSFAGYKKILDEADIMNIVTKKDKRNNGFAKLILKALIDMAHNEEIKSITLEVNENNTSAIALYQSFDFKQVGLRKNYYNGTQNAILMTLYIK